MGIINVDGVKLMTLEEIKNSKGAGLAEIWYEADEGGEQEEEKILMHCAWCRGNLIFEDGSSSDTHYLDRWYNKQYGERVWTGSRVPTEEEREAAEWNGK